jgi:hypothetical protein
MPARKSPSWRKTGNRRVEKIPLEVVLEQIEKKGKVKRL